MIEFFGKEPSAKSLEFTHNLLFLLSAQHHLEPEQSETVRILIVDFDATGLLFIPDRQLIDLMFLLL